VEYLLEEQVEKVLSLLTPVNRVVMRVALHTGLRISDVLSLKKSDIDKGQQFWITESKTGKRKRIALTADLLRDMQSVCGSFWVFENRTDRAKHRSRQAVWRDVKRAERALRLPQNIGTHSARKVYAVRLMEEYGSIPKVQKALNHDRDSTTMIYAMADTLLRAKYRKRGKRRKA
jgi:integrase